MTADPVTSPSGLAGRLAEKLAKIDRWRMAVIVAAAAGSLMVALVPAPDGVPQKAITILALTSFTVAMWATIAMPQPYAAIIFLAGSLITGSASPAAVGSGFLSSALWLVFGGLLIGTAAERSGFGKFIARKFFGGFLTSYPQMIFGVLLGTTILSFFVPSNMGRLAITVPIVMALAAEAGYERGTPGYIGILLAATVGNFTIALAILPANLLNIMVIGAGETLYRVTFSYLEYLWLCGPVLGLVKFVLVWFTITRMFRPPPPRPPVDASMANMLGPEARRVALILGLAIALWATDVLHGIRPGFVAFAGGLLCLVPGIGVLKPADALDAKKFLMLIWIATVLSLGAVLTESGASALLSSALAGVAGVEGQSPIYGHLAIAYLTGMISAVATIGGAVPVVMAAAGDIATATGLPIKMAVLSVTAGMSALFFPFVAAPIVIGLTLGGVPFPAATRFMLVLAVATCAIIIPLNALWWWVAGVLP